MGIEMYKNTKIYIACPANVSTGGVEVLHQIAYHIVNDLNKEAFMYYYDFKNFIFKTPVHPAYKIYNNHYVLKIPEYEDNEKNILLVPEILKGLLLLPKYKKIRKAIWFLSVDNYYLSRLTKKDYFIPRVINKIFKILSKNKLIIFDITSQKILNKLIQKYDYKNDPLLKFANFYLFQSYYAMQHFKGLNPKYYLSDYLNKNFLENQVNLSKKEDIVAYNPKKGFSFTKKIISSAKNIKFVPLINMNREQIMKILQRTKVYIDFGNHPGRDKIPREAAILGCCVITGRRGAAKFFEDIPIPDSYKFEDKEENIPLIVNKIKDCFKNFRKRYRDFDYYREVIKKEPQEFIENLKKIFINIEN